MKRFSRQLVWGVVLMLGGLTCSHPLHAQDTLRSGKPVSPVGKLFAVLYERGPHWDSSKSSMEQPHLQEHVGHLKGLGERLIGAGPFVSGSGGGMVALIIFSASNQDEAEDWLKTDPMIATGVSTGKVQEWGAPWVKPFKKSPSR
ncbi:MAG: hypothetical protein HY277_08305 [Ignavibacteriales bacterium]|nr:hypothetical protein [Ignavibacteriales bacterium]